MSQNSNPAEAALIAVLGIGFLFFWLVTDFSSIENWSNDYIRFVWAITHTIAPTSILDLVIEIVITAIGFVAGSRANVLLGVFLGVLLYGLTSFILAWIAAPVG